MILLYEIIPHAFHCRPIVPMDNVVIHMYLNRHCKCKQESPGEWYGVEGSGWGRKRIMPHNPCEGTPQTQLLDPLPYRDLPHHCTECAHGHNCWLAAAHSILLSHWFHFLQHPVLSFWQKISFLLVTNLIQDES